MNEELLEAIYKAGIDCRKHKKNKYGTKKFDYCSLYNICNLVNEIETRTYKLMPAQCFIVYYPAPREVFCSNYRDRVVQHFVYNELNPCIEKDLIFDAANCRKGKGTDFAIHRVQRFVRNETHDYNKDAYYLKADLKGFFMSINREILLNIVTDFINNKYLGKFKYELLYLVKIIIMSDPTVNCIKLSKQSEFDKIPKHKTLFGNTNGLPIGNISSQLFANMYLNKLDHFLKSKFRSVSRYVDDIIIIDKDKQKLITTIPQIEQILVQYGLKLNKSKTIINNCNYGIDFLGTRIYPFYTIVSDKKINRLYASTINKCTNNLYMSLNSIRGQFIHYHGRNILNYWYKNQSQEFQNKIKLNPLTLIFYKIN